MTSGELVSFVILKVPKPRPPSWLKCVGVDLPLSVLAIAAFRDEANAARLSKGDKDGSSMLYQCFSPSCPGCGGFRSKSSGDRVASPGV